MPLASATLTLENIASNAIDFKNICGNLAKTTFRDIPHTLIIMASAGVICINYSMLQVLRSPHPFEYTAVIQKQHVSIHHTVALSIYVHLFGHISVIPLSFREPPRVSVRVCGISIVYIGATNLFSSKVNTLSMPCAMLLFTESSLLTPL